MQRPVLRPDKFDVEAFLRDTWQKKPLLIRNPWEAWTNPIEPDELAGLATDDDVETRLIDQSRLTPTAEHGPISAARFGKLDKQPWTMLVQAVDNHVPEVAALIDPFRFVPNWRIDDVMVSYATDGGGVGAHFDQYDVFLIQGLGKRRWQVGGTCDAATAMVPHDDLRLIANFEPVEEWILEPGDILYVPPRIAHNGVAVGDDCMTYSVGFRAPSRGELVEGWAEELAGAFGDDDRFRDGLLDAHANPGEISAEAIARLHAMVTEAVQDRDAFARWFGRYNSTRKYPEIDWSPEKPITTAKLGKRLAKGAGLYRNPASRFSFIRKEDGSVLLFVDGEAFVCAAEVVAVAEQLCEHDRVTLSGAPSPAVIDLIAALINQGSLAFDED
jgi:50S ribosomal protein L16 3-hydroxylase